MEKMILRKHNNEQLDSLRNRYKNVMIEIIQNGNIDNAFENIKLNLILKRRRILTTIRTWKLPL